MVDPFDIHGRHRPLQNSSNRKPFLNSSVPAKNGELKRFKPHETFWLNEHERNSCIGKGLYAGSYCERRLPGGSLPDRWLDYTPMKAIIDLGSVSQYVKHMSCSDNNVSKITSFVREGSLEESDNSPVRKDMSKMYLSPSVTRCRLGGLIPCKTFLDGAFDVYLTPKDSWYPTNIVDQIVKHLRTSSDQCEVTGNKQGPQVRFVKSISDDMDSAADFNLCVQTRIRPSQRIAAVVNLCYTERHYHQKDIRANTGFTHDANLIAARYWRPAADARPPCSKNTRISAHLEGILMGTNLATDMEYYWLKVPGGGDLPSGNMVARFCNLMIYLGDRFPGDIVMVHCTHGVNRTGFFIVMFLICVYGLEYQLSLSLFAKSRGYPISRLELIEHSRILAASLNKLGYLPVTLQSYTRSLPISRNFKSTKDVMENQITSESQKAAHLNKIDFSDRALVIGPAPIIGFRPEDVFTWFQEQKCNLVEILAIERATQLRGLSEVQCNIKACSRRCGDEPTHNVTPTKKRNELAACSKSEPAVNACCDTTTEINAMPPGSDASSGPRCPFEVDISAVNFGCPNCINGDLSNHRILRAGGELSSNHSTEPIGLTDNNISSGLLHHAEDIYCLNRHWLAVVVFSEAETCKSLLRDVAQDGVHVNGVTCDVKPISDMKCLFTKCLHFESQNQQSFSCAKIYDEDDVHARCPIDPSRPVLFHATLAPNTIDTTVNCPKYSHQAAPPLGSNSCSIQIPFTECQTTVYNSHFIERGRNL